MLSLKECREYLPASLSDDEILLLRDLLDEFWENIINWFLEEICYK